MKEVSCLEMQHKPDYSITPLGDSALEIRFGNRIDSVVHNQVMALYHSFLNAPVAALTDLIPAYCTLTLLFNPQQLGPSGFTDILPELQKRIDTLEIQESTARPLLHIPVCYEESYATDLEAVCRQCHLSPAEVIALHSNSEYRVFMLGFLPGFPYLGTLPEPLHLPRKQEPIFVKGGTIAIAGSQTGIYPIGSPGGWWTIGQTPLSIFNAAMQQPCLFAPGDRVHFYPVDKKAFLNIERAIATTDFLTIREKGGWL